MGLSNYFVGVDLGQCHDYTAIAVLQRIPLTGDWDAAAFAYRKSTALRLRYLDRIPLGTPYTDIVERVRQVVRAPDLANHCQLMVDATGVGRPVIDMLRRANLGCNMRPAMITGGDLEHFDQGYYKVPKRDLIVGLQVLLQRNALQIAKGLEHSETFAKEMADMRVEILPSGHERYGAWRNGQHDDLVLAVALACWGVRKVYPQELSGEGAYWKREDVGF